MQVSLVDLDPKAVSKIPEHYELDRRIVRPMSNSSPHAFVNQ